MTFKPGEGPKFKPVFAKNELPELPGDDKRISTKVGQKLMSIDFREVARGVGKHSLEWQLMTCEKPLGVRTIGMPTGLARHAESADMTRRYYHVCQVHKRAEFAVMPIACHYEWSQFDLFFSGSPYFRVRTWSWKHYRHSETHPDCECNSEAVMD